MKKILPLIIILINMCSIIVTANYDIPKSIRIGLFYNSTSKSKITILCNTNIQIYSEELDEEEVYKIDSGSKIVLEVDKKSDEYVKLFVNDVVLGALSGKIKIVPDKNKNEEQKFILEGKEYRGILEINRKEGENLTVINELGLEEYLYSVVPSEIETSSNIEAIKAQAVAARTYTVGEMKRHKSNNFDLCATTHCQMYRGTEWETAKTRNAVDETKGMVMTYDNEIISAFYFSTSGGYTEDVTNVWTANLPYLKAVEDPYEPKKDPWIVTYTKEELEELLKNKGVDIGEVLNLKITKFTKSGRVYSILFTGTKGTKEYTKESTRTLFNLKSQMYILSADNYISVPEEKAIISYIDEKNDIKTVDILDNTVKTVDGNIVNNNTKILTADGEKNIEVTVEKQVQPNSYAVSNEYVFTGYGIGHGIGMSQNGAKGMANAGFSFEEILKHYYTGIEIQK